MAAGDVALHGALALIGFESSESAQVAAALSQIQSSLDQMAVQNKQISDALDGLRKELQRQNFLNSQANVVETSGAIQDTLIVISDWIENDITPSPPTDHANRA